MSDKVVKEIILIHHLRVYYIQMLIANSVPHLLSIASQMSRKEPEICKLQPNHYQPGQLVEQFHLQDEKSSSRICREFHRSQIEFAATVIDHQQ